MDGNRKEIEGDYDLRGYLDLDDDVRPGFSRLSYSVDVDADADGEVLDDIRWAAEATSPMFDNARNGAPIDGEVRAVAAESV